MQVSKTFQSSVFSGCGGTGPEMRESKTFKSNLNIFTSPEPMAPTAKQREPACFSPNYNHKREQLSPSRTSSTFQSNLPIFDHSVKMTNRRKVEYEQFSPKYQEEAAVNYKNKELHGEKASLCSPKRAEKKQSSEYDIKRQYHQQFQGNGIFEDSKPFQRVERPLQEKEKPKGPEQQANRRIRENYGDKETQEYKNIKGGFVDDQNDCKRRANHNYSNLHDLESDPKVDTTQKNQITANTQKWHHVQQSAHIEATSPRAKKMLQMSSVLGNQDLYKQAGQREQRPFSPQADIRQTIHAEQSQPAQPCVSNQEVQVLEFNYSTSEHTDPALFSRRCKQQGIHLMNHQPNSNLVDPSQKQQGSFQVRLNNPALVSTLGRIAEECGQNIQKKEKQLGLTNKNLAKCTLTECFDEKLQQEKRPDVSMSVYWQQDLDCYTRKVNNLRQSDQQDTLHTKKPQEKDDCTRRQNVMQVHDYYGKIKRLDDKLTRLSLQSQARKKQ